MGAYSEYLNMNLDFQALQNERKKQLLTISKLRGDRAILVFAADLNKPNSAIDYTDILAVQDQLANLKGKEIDIIIETPGGIAEVVEDIITMVRDRFGYEKVGMIVPGWTKSAGTIFVMAGDEILMGNSSALGPIDAQIGYTNGKRVSAHAFLEGMDKMKEEVTLAGKLNPAFIPILQNISPGEIQQAQNAQDFSKSLVTEWLEKYKFKYWDKRRTSGLPVTPEYKRIRAEEIATKLANQGRWLTHGRSIRIRELETELNLIITDYTKQPDLNDAITRYYTLLRMTFETNMYKLFETPTTQIYRFTGVEKVPNPPKNLPPDTKRLIVKLPCQKCKSTILIQANFEKNVALKEGAVPFPETNVLKCPNCSADINLLNIRLQLEAQTRKKVI